MSLLSFVFPQTLAVYKSKINGVIKVKEIFGQRQIYVDNFPQSGDVLEKMWELAITDVKCLLQTKPKDQRYNIKRCLVLGVGGGTVIKVIKKYCDKAKIIGVEIDEVMLEIGKRYFNISSFEDVDFINDDAFLWVGNYNKQKCFDLIIIDIFIGRKSVLDSSQKQFLKKLKSMLDNKGIVMVNTDYGKKRERELQNFMNACRQVFKTVELPFLYSKNSLLFLSTK